MGGTTFAGN